MTLKKEERDALVGLRLQRANETIVELKAIVQLKYWRIAANRLYYACYYAASALLLDNNFTTHTHKGVISQFGLHFVSKGLLNEEMGKLFKKLFNLRQRGDYDDWKVIQEKDITPLIEPAEKFIKEIENLISQNT